MNGLEPSLFGAGPETKTAYELYGEEGTGKSEMLMNFVSSCILPDVWNDLKIGGHNACVVFIDTDYKFSILHLALLLEKRLRGLFKDDSEMNSCMEDMESFIKSCLKRLQLLRCNSSSNLLITLISLENILNSNSDISVLMIDSISSFYWLDKCSGVDNTNMNSITATLNSLLDTYHIVLFVTRAAIVKHKSKDGDRHTEALTADYMCHAWHNFIKHQYVFIPLADSREVKVVCQTQNVNTRFSVSDSGIKFK